jgi:hypothetical protein
MNAGEDVVSWLTNWFRNLGNASFCDHRPYIEEEQQKGPIGKRFVSGCLLQQLDGRKSFSSKKEVG